MTESQPPVGRSPGATRWHGALRLGHAVLRQVVLDPFNGGRLGLRELPVGLRAVATITLAVIVIFLVLMLGAGLWTELLPTVATDLDISYPLGAIQFVAAGVVLAVSLIFVATVHLRGILRWAGWAATSLVLILGTASMLVVSILFAVVPLGGVTVLLLVMVRRRRRDFHLGELAVTMFVFSSCWSTTWFLYQLVAAGGPTFVVSGLVRFLIPFIAPLACLAGVALAEIATSVATGTVTALQEEAPRLRWWWVLGALAVAVLVANGLADPSDVEVGWSALMVGLCMGGWFGIGVLGRGGRALVPVSSYQPEVLWDGFRTTLWTLAVLLSLQALVVGVINIAIVALTPFLSSDTIASFILTRTALNGQWGSVARSLLVAVVCLVGVVVQLRRGRTVFARLLWVVAVVTSMVVFDSARQPYSAGWSVQGLVSVLAVVVLGVGVWLLHHARLTRTGAVALASALAVTLLFPVRELISDPVTAVLGTGLASVLLLSAIWQLLTEGGPTRRHSRAFPREARLLFFLGYQLLWVITAAVIVLTREGKFGDVLLSVELGDQVFGTTLLLASVLGLLTVAIKQPRRPLRRFTSVTHSPPTSEGGDVGRVPAQPPGARGGSSAG